MPSGNFSSSQGSTVSFDGSQLGSLLSIRVTGGSAAQADVTSMESPLTGDVIKKELDALGIEPGQVAITFLGPPAVLDVGQKGSVDVQVGGGSVLSGEGFLVSYEIEASVGDLIRGSATFQLTGA